MSCLNNYSEKKFYVKKYFFFDFLKIFFKIRIIHILYMKILTKRLVLRDITMKDASALVKAINNINIAKWLQTVPYPYSLKDAKSYIRNSIKESKKKPREKYPLSIELAGRRGLIGGVSINNVNIFEGTASIGYWLSQDYWRQGIMQEAVTSIIDFAFDTLKLRRIDLVAFADNEGSNCLARKMGFQYEGTRKEKCRSKADGKIYDQNLYGLLRRDWKARKNLYI
jgi:[ribosomal protein S5]-alanine N-acetyltransferase